MAAHVVIDASVVRPPLSGVQFAVAEQCVALAEVESGPQLTVLCRDPDVRDRVRDAGAVAEAPPDATQRAMCRVLWQQLALPNLLRDVAADLLYAPAYTCPLRSPVPVVLFVHDLIALQHPELCSRRNVLHMRALLPRSIARAQAVLVSSRSVGDAVAEMMSVPRERIHQVPLGVDSKRFRAPADVPAELGLEAGRPYILFVGNLEPKKGIETLLGAYRTCAETIGCDLVLAGRAAWGCRELVDQLRGYAGPGSIHWLGRVPGSALPALYQNARALVLPSLVEGFGLPVLEAMASGTPVIHSDIPALTETAGGGGASFRVSDTGDLARCLADVCGSHVLREELAGRGRERAEALSWSRWAEDALAVFAEAATDG